MAVRIRMKRCGRKHRPFFRICATDARAPRDGRVIEVLGTYDPMIPLTDARVTLNFERVQYWLSVGAQPSEKVKILLKKYGPNGTHLEKQREAIEKLRQMQAARKAAAEHALVLAEQKKAAKKALEEVTRAAEAEAAEEASAE
ncbi:30S ribosomal protein S16 [Thermogutta sp.]|uniref:30S ribosomal protein S16 n=1 Tax=Thermogutta sp. TaxID=1962930 RepID=UPI00321F6631